jgi:hypothetical protein
VVLADAEDVEADLLGELGFLQQLPQALLGPAFPCLRKRVDADLDGVNLVAGRRTVGPLTPQWSLAGTPPAHHMGLRRGV